MVCILGFCEACVFFFQAEDGIRDLVRSRGLGDVYKRQIHDKAMNIAREYRVPLRVRSLNDEGKGTLICDIPVSYTHLTLPTIYSV